MSDLLSGKPNGVAPLKWSQSLNFIPTLVSYDEKWTRLAVQRLPHPKCEIEVPALSDHTLIIALSDGVDIHRHLNGDQKSTRIRRGQFTLTPAFQASAWQIDANLDVLQLFLSPILIQEVLDEITTGESKDPDLIPRLFETDRFIENLSTMLLQEMQQPSPTTRLFVESIARLAAIRLVRSHSGRNLRNSCQSSAVPLHCLQKALEYMKEYLSEDIALRDIAAAAELTVSELSRFFKMKYGSPPHQYLIELRVEKAKDLLTSTSKEIADIALKTGFSSQGHLTTVFQKKVGVSPLRYRKLFQ